MRMYMLLLKILGVDFVCVGMNRNYKTFRKGTFSFDYLSCNQ